MHKIGVLVSGRGSNLQAIMDRIADGYLPLEIAVVISDKPDAFALERAQKADIKTVAVERNTSATVRQNPNFQNSLSRCNLGADFCTAVNRISLFTCIRSGGRIAV